MGGEGGGTCYTSVTGNKIFLHTVLFVMFNLFEKCIATCLYMHILERGVLIRVRCDTEFEFVVERWCVASETKVTTPARAVSA